MRVRRRPEQIRFECGFLISAREDNGSETGGTRKHRLALELMERKRAGGEEDGV